MLGAFETGAPPEEGGSGARPVGRAPLGRWEGDGGAGRTGRRAGRARCPGSGVRPGRGGLAVRAAGALPAGGGAGWPLAARPFSVPVLGKNPMLRILRSSSGHFPHLA